MNAPYPCGDDLKFERELGSGTFGTVYLARQVHMDREVAVKFPHPDFIQDEAGRQRFLDEARQLVEIKSDYVVAVLWAGRAKDDLETPFVATEFIRGGNLREKMDAAGADGLSEREIVEWITQAAEGLEVLHNEAGLLHRDVKPENILLQLKGDRLVAMIADIGLAIAFDAEKSAAQRIAGTPAYMSPEQASHETHRIQASSDVFSLGSVLYELLTGEVAFPGENVVEILRRIRLREVRRPREINDRIMPELERICLKALAKRVVDRYATAGDFAEDLKRIATDPTLRASQGASGASGQASSVFIATIEPKGLRAFEASDASAFVDLLPGVRDRERLPNSITFWVNKINAMEPEDSFSVGLVYGPSGCGKSSLLRAGVLPRLSGDVKQLVIEATPDNTERDLLLALRKLCPALSEELDLVESMSLIRADGAEMMGHKVLIVLDQFEQYLYDRSMNPDDELIRALRFCDGEYSQAVLTVRDDFWIPINRFFDELDFPIQEGVNAQSVDLFESEHAKRVLLAFGLAYRQLPETFSSLSEEQWSFTNRVISELADQDRVISVQIALIAEMFKNREWRESELESIGGVRGIGEVYLEENICGPEALPELRDREKAVHGMLSALLPSTATEIKGSRRSLAELAAETQMSEPECSELLGHLDRSLRVITAVVDESGSRYQLAHDYLVPSIRDWLARKAEETPEGRAHLSLDMRARLFEDKEEKKQLPGLSEWIRIGRFTDRVRYSTREARMMRAAGRMHRIRILAVFLLSMTTWWALREIDGRIVSGQLLELAMAAEPGDLDEISRGRVGYDAWFNPLVDEQLGLESRLEQRVNLRLLRVRGQPEPEFVELLFEDMLKLPVVDYWAACEFIEKRSSEKSEPWTERDKKVWIERLEASIKSGSGFGIRLRVASLTASLGKPWDESSANSVALWLSREPEGDILAWGPSVSRYALLVGERSLEILKGSHSIRAAAALAAVGSKQTIPEFLIQGIKVADATVGVLADQLKDEQLAEIEPELTPHCFAKWPEGTFDTFFDESSTRRIETEIAIPVQEASRMILAAARRGRWGAFEKALEAREYPDVGVRLIHTAHRVLGQSEFFVERFLSGEASPKLKRSLCFLIGVYGPKRVPSESLRKFIDACNEEYEDLRDAGLISAIEWVDQEWRALGIGVIKEESTGDRGAFDDPVHRRDGLLYRRFDPVERVQLNPDHSRMRGGNGRWVPIPVPASYASIERPFFVATRLLTWVELEEFYEEENLTRTSHGGVYASISPVEAALFCNWLSRRHDLEPYFDDEAALRELIHAEGVLSTHLLKAWVLCTNPNANGYRFPSRVEYIHFSRAGSQTLRFWGGSDEFYNEYLVADSRTVTQPGFQKPNDYGVFSTMVSNEGVAEIGLWIPGEAPEDFRQLPLLGSRSHSQFSHLVNWFDHPRSATSVNRSCSVRLVRNAE